MVESNTRIKINIGYEFHLLIVVYNDIYRDSLQECVTTIWYKNNLRMQNIIYYKLCRIIRRGLTSTLIVHRFLQRKWCAISSKIGHWILLVGKLWWEFSTLVGYVGSWRERFADAENFFSTKTFQSSKLLLSYGFNRFIPTL